MTDSEGGAEAVRKFAIGLFDREDGRAANWPLIAETLFKAAFEALDEVPGHEKSAALLRRVHDGAYSRIVQNEPGERGAENATAAQSVESAPASALRRDFRP